MQIYKNWFNANNVRFSEESYGIEFSYQGLNFLLGDNSDDQQYLNLMLPAIYAVNDNLDKVYAAMNKINDSIKCVKAVLHEETVWLHLEMFIDSTPDIEDFMTRIIDILMAARMHFLVEMMK